MIRSLLCLAIVLGSAACLEQARGWAERTDNPGIAAETLAHVDGCTIYRFHDGYSHYFVRCPNSETLETHEVSCGKSCVRPEDVTTSSAPAIRKP